MGTGKENPIMDSLFWKTMSIEDGGLDGDPVEPVIEEDDDEEDDSEMDDPDLNDESDPVAGDEDEGNSW